MIVERSGTDLILNVADGELERDPNLLDRAADLALEISTVYSLRVVVSPRESALHRELFSTRFSKVPGKNWNLTIRRVRASLCRVLHTKRQDTSQFDIPA